MQLREYQIDAITKIRTKFAQGKNRIVVCSATGSGKTVIFCKLAQMVFEKGNSILIITNRKELLSQTDGKLAQFGLIPDILDAKAKKMPQKAVCVAMVETLKRRLERFDYVEFVKSFDLIIIDECHIANFDRLFQSLSTNQRVLGFTATPERKRPQKELATYYDDLVDVIPISKLITDGHLAYPETFGVPMDLSNVKLKGGDYDIEMMGKAYDNKAIYTGAVQNYLKYSKGEKAIAFCSTIQNSESLKNIFCENGINAKHFDCYMNDKDRNEVLTWFYNTPDAVLCNVGILTTGFDCPDIKTVILYRATKSLPLFLQMVGRGSRTTETKKTFKILDFGNNIKEHGFWEDNREWTLFYPKIKKKKKKDGVSGVKSCSQCEALLKPNVSLCPFCGHVFEKKQKTQIEIILEKLTPGEIQRFAETCNFKELEEIKNLKGYKTGWVLHKFNSFQQFKDYEKFKGYKNGWAEFQWEKYKTINTQQDE